MAWSPACSGSTSGASPADVERRHHRRHAAASAQPLSPAQLASHYNLPSGDGSGQTVAIAEFGGGYFADDLRAFCAGTAHRFPRITPVTANGAQILTLAQIQQLPQQQQQQQLEDSVEVNMDVQIVAGLAPGAEQIVYFSSFDEQGWVDLINQVSQGKPAPAVAASEQLGARRGRSRLVAGARFRRSTSVSRQPPCSGSACASPPATMAPPIRRATVAPTSTSPLRAPHALAVGGTMLSGTTDVVWWESPGERTSSGGGATGRGV